MKALLAIIALYTHTALLGQVNRIPVRSPDSVVSIVSQLGFLLGRVSITGTDTPLPNVKVTLNTNQFAALTDAVGDFSFGAISPGWYELTASLPGYKSLARSVLVLKAKQVNLDLDLTPDYSRPEFHKTGGLKLFVSDANTGLPSHMARIIFFELGSSHTADFDGIYTTYNLPPGKHHIKVTLLWHNISVLDSFEVSPSKFTIHFTSILDSSDIRNHRCSLPHRKLRAQQAVSPDEVSSISGIVRDSVSRKPVPLASVFLAPYADQVLTDSTGHFAISNLPPGRYCLTVFNIGFRRQTVHDILIKPAKNVFLQLSLAHSYY